MSTSRKAAPAAAPAVAIEKQTEKTEEQNLLDCCIEATAKKPAAAAVCPVSQIELSIQEQALCCGVWSKSGKANKLVISVAPDGTFSVRVGRAGDEGGGLIDTDTEMPIRFAVKGKVTP